jgi:hypothetical protein
MSNISKTYNLDQYGGLVRMSVKDEKGREQIAFLSPEGARELSELLACAADDSEAWSNAKRTARESAMSSAMSALGGGT